MNILTVQELIDRLSEMVVNGQIKPEAPIIMEGCDCDGIADDLYIHKDKTVNDGEYENNYEPTYTYKGDVVYITRGN